MAEVSGALHGEWQLKQEQERGRQDFSNCSRGAFNYEKNPKENFSVAHVSRAQMSSCWEWGRRRGGRALRNPEIKPRNDKSSPYNEQY